MKSNSMNNMCGIESWDHPATKAATPLGLGELNSTVTQGSSCLPTLGWWPESRWDSPMTANPVREDSPNTQHASRGFHSTLRTPHSAPA
jgi:hypothetical protein